MPNMSGEVLGLMMTGIILAVALVVITQLQTLDVITAESYAANATNQILAGLYTFAQFFAVIVLIVVIGVIVMYLQFKKR